jgi:hypothetical protein
MTAVSAFLLVDVGMLHTRVTLVDSVEGTTRLIGQVTVPSTHQPPARQLLVAVVEAASALSDVTGRLLVQSGRLLMPQRENLDGVDRVVMTSSAGGVLRAAVVALARDVSAAAVLQALAGGPYIVSHLVSLARPSDDHDERSWFVRQAEALASVDADVLILAGGFDDGAADGVMRLAHLIHLTNTAPVQARSRPVIYAGNAAARQAVQAELGGHMPLIVTENVQPALDVRRLEPLRQMLAEQYDRACLARLPGAALLEQAGWPRLRTSESAQQLMVRFLAGHFQRRVLYVDCGSAAIRASYADDQQSADLVLSEYGLAHHLAGLLAAAGPAALQRWLPYQISESDLLDRLLNRSLRPAALPHDLRDALIDLAAARVALAAAADGLQSMVARYSVDWLIAGGGLFGGHLEPAPLLLTLLDGLQLTDTPTALCEVLIDRFGLLTACGALAAHDPAAAVDLLEHDFSTNVPLATVLVPGGQGRAGTRALEVELVPVDGPPQRRTVAFGELVRLPLAVGDAAQLRVTPAAGVRLGAAAAGEPLETDPAEVRGSLLGLVIDLRGRPLPLPDDADGRIARLRAWHAALGFSLDDARLAPIVPPQPAADEQTSAVELDELPTLAVDAVETLRRTVTRRRRARDE